MIVVQGRALAGATGGVGDWPFINFVPKMRRQRSKITPTPPDRWGRIIRCSEVNRAESLLHHVNEIVV